MIPISYLCSFGSKTKKYHGEKICTTNNTITTIIQHTSAASSVPWRIPEASWDSCRLGNAWLDRTPDSANAELPGCGRTRQKPPGPWCRAAATREQTTCHRRTPTALPTVAEPSDYHHRLCMTAHGTVRPYHAASCWNTFQTVASTSCPTERNRDQNVSSFHRGP